MNRPLLCSLRPSTFDVVDNETHEVIGSVYLTHRAHWAAEWRGQELGSHTKREDAARHVIDTEIQHREVEKLLQ